MPYTINKTNGGFVTTIPDGNIDDTTSLTLIGKNYSGYGEILNENFVKLLENFANSSEPTGTILPGQLWWDTATKTLKVNVGTNQWKIISGSTASNTAPENRTIGDLWFDTLAAQLKVFNGTGWTLIGPSYSTSTGTAGAVVDSVFDDGVGAAHVIIKYLIGNDNVVAIMSKDAAFSPQQTITGFDVINPGLTMSSTISNAGFYGTASNADKLDGLNSTQFLRADANTTTTGILTVANDAGVLVGQSGDLRLTVSGSDAYIRNTTSIGDIIFQVNKSGVNTTSMFIDGTTGEVRLPDAIPANNNSTRLATTAYVDAQAVLAASSSGFASGTKLLFAQATAPTGWTKSTTHDNKALRVVSGSTGGSSGGSVAFTAAFTSQTVSGTVGYSAVSGVTEPTTLTPNQMPAHQHAIVSNTGTGGTLTGANYIDSAYTGYNTNDDYALRGISGAATLGLTSAAGASEGHSHSFTNQGNHNHTFSGTGINLAVAYVDVIIATKN